ncbi:MAG: hypothetical protein QXF97_06445 [Candidatus Caldarchaeum sp.]
MKLDVTPQLSFKCDKCPTRLFTDQLVFELHMVRHQLEEISDTLFTITEVLGTISHAKR